MAGEHSIDLGIDGLGPAEPIGEGGNAHVYRCRQESLDRDVAVKILKRSSDAATQRRFGREQRAMGRMSQHDGIVTVYESGLTSNGEPYIVMPLLPRSLRDELDSTGGLPWSEAVDVMIQIAETVEFAHQAGLIHRDLKPANIMRSTSGRPLVADFGISRIVDSEVSVQSTALTLTPAFSPPESLSGAEAVATTDVYALGATLYALIEGHPPFVDSTTSMNLLALIRSIADDPVPALTGPVPRWLDDVIASAMAKDPQHRTQTAAGLAADLRSQSAGASNAVGGSATRVVSRRMTPPPPPAIAPAAPPPPPVASGPTSRRTMLLAGAAALVAVIMVAVVVVVTKRGDETAAVEPAAAVISAPLETDATETEVSPEEEVVASETEAGADVVVPEPDLDFDESAPIVQSVAMSTRLPSDQGMVRIALTDAVIGFAGDAQASNSQPYEPERVVGDVDYFVDSHSTTNAFFGEWLLYGFGDDSAAYVERAPDGWVEAEPGALPTPGAGTRDDPVVGVSLDSAREYCTYVNKRLVSEIEWELAAAGDFLGDDSVAVQNWVDEAEAYGPVPVNSLVLRGTFGSESLDDRYRTIGQDGDVLRSSAGLRCAADEARASLAVDLSPPEAETFYEDDFSDLDSGWPGAVPDGVSSIGYHPTDVFHLEAERPWTKIAVVAPEAPPADSAVTAAVELRKPTEAFDLFSYGLIARSSEAGYVTLTVRPTIDGDDRSLVWCLAETTAPILAPGERYAARTGQSPETTCDGALAQGQLRVEGFINILSLQFNGATPFATIDGSVLPIAPGTSVGVPAGVAGFYVETFDETELVHVHYDEIAITTL